MRGLAKGGIDPHSPGDSVEYIQTSGLKVTSEESVPVEVDGELWGRSKEIEFASFGHQLEVLAPPEVPESKWYALLRSLNPWTH